MRMEIIADCKEETRASRIVCQENRRKITFINSDRKRVVKIEVDGCQIKEGLRCDYLVTLERLEHYIELKGHDLRHAFSQIIRTIELLGQENATRRSYIISSRSPLSTAEIQIVRLKFRKYYQSNLVVKNKNFEERI